MTIKSFRSMKGAGILADISAKEARHEYLRYNLIYGFNGSGKSTLSRMLASLQQGFLPPTLPEGCAFEIEMADGTTFGAPSSLHGLEERVCVFNEDFVEQNLQWAEGRANSIFFISQSQAQLADELKAVEGRIPERATALTAAKALLAANEKTLTTYKRERAKVIAGALRLVGNRKYDATDLKKDYETKANDAATTVSEEALVSLDEIVKRSSPPPVLGSIELPYTTPQAHAASARYFASLSLAKAALDELESHPSMVAWLKQGHDYHAKNGLQECLLCGNTLTIERQNLLAEALDDQVAKLISDLDATGHLVDQAFDTFDAARKNAPKVTDLAISFQAPYSDALAALNEAINTAWKLLVGARDVIARRRAEPTRVVLHEIPADATLAATCESLRGALTSANDLIDRHNKETADFEKHQVEARDAIRRHYLAEDRTVYQTHCDDVTTAAGEVQKIAAEVSELEAKVLELRTKVREHGPAADKITKLVRRYLGHGELTIFAAGEGYELHRHGKPVEGPPSEGEKTAIALCYFLTTLEADGRAIEDLIVVVDDPVSSLDTKAMNYACALVRNTLERAQQVFVLTHNQHCMNEFKKAWKGHVHRKNDPNGTFNFIDVRVPEGAAARSARLVAMPKHLEAYDSEYHFLCHKMLEFEAAGEEYSEYHFMMPHIMRRVMEVFLAFKEPGGHGIGAKLLAVCKDHDELDPSRMAALERLVQVESHSDSLDDLVGHSSMTIEEARDANAALLLMMKVADARHEQAIRKQCKAA